MQKITINNNLFRHTCPCCQSKDIHLYAKSLDYAKPVCYSTTEIVLLNKAELWECRLCNSIFTQNAVTDKDAQYLYSIGESSSRWHENSTFEEEKTNDLIATVQPFIINKECVLDVGCSTGRLLDYIKLNGVKKTYGIEYSNESRDICFKKGHIMLDHISEFENFFDIVFAFDLVEHLYEIPVFFNQVEKALKKEGHLIILTGNPDALTAHLLKSDWWYYNFPEHIVFPSYNFYKNIEKFRIEAYKKVFNGKSYKSSLLKYFFKLIYYYKKNGKYIGLPSFVKDHHLIILRKNV